MRRSMSHKDAAPSAWRRTARLSTALRCPRSTKHPLELTDNLPPIAAMQGALGCRIDAIGQKVYRTVGKPDVGSA